MLTPRLLAIHRAVLNLGTLRAAAASLGYSVSAVSNQLTSLERETGMTLWEKDGRRLRPTTAGLLLGQLGERILEEIKTAESAIDDLRNGRAGRIRVAAFRTACDTLLPTAIADLSRTMPGIIVQTVTDEAEGALRRLREGAADIAIVFDPYGPGDEFSDEFHRTHLFGDEYRILLHEHHPLAKRRLIDIGDLAEDSWFVTDTVSSLTGRATFDLCRRAGFTPRIVAETDEYSVAQGYVAAGLAVGLAPLLALSVVRRHVVARKLRRPPEPRHIWVLTRLSLAAQPAVRSLTTALMDARSSLSR